MYPIRLEIENFCCYSKSKINFDSFSSAIVIGKIRGNEKFSNGAGKSTILHAIKYVLFGKTDFSTLDKIIRRNTDFCKVVFDFRSSEDGEVYRIARSKNKKTGTEVRIFKQVNNTWQDLTEQRNEEAEKEIYKIIKVNYKTFCNSVLFSQSDFSGIASLTASKRKIILKEVLQLGVYSKYESVAKRRVSDIMKEIERERTILSTLGTPEEDILSFKKELNHIDESIVNLTKNISSLKIDYEKENVLYNNLMSEFSSMKEKEDNIRKKKISIETENINIGKVIKEYKNKISSINKSTEDLSKDIENISNILKKISASKCRNKSEVKLDIEENNKLIIEKKANYRAQLLKLEELKIPFPTGSVCKNCRQEINFKSEEARSSCQKLIDAEIIEKEKEISSLKKEINELENTGKKLSEEGVFIQNIEKEISNKTNTLSVKIKEKEVQENIHKEYFELLKQNEESLVDKSKELENMNKIILSNNPEYFLNLKKNCSIKKDILLKISDEILILNKKASLLSNNKAVLLHKIEQRNKDLNKIQDCKTNIEGLEKKYIVHQKVAQAFGSKGIPALITHTILDDYQVESNNLLSQLRPGLQLKFSVIKDRDDGDEEDTLDICFIINGHEFEFAQLSGAQQLLASLALKLGLATVMKKRLNTEIKFLLIDEVDQSLDSGGLEAFESAIKQLQKDFKILVITHNDKLKDKFNNAILVEQDENLVSTAKVVNTW